MNAKQVLSKIVSLLSSEKEVNLTYAKLEDGTIVESPTFDVGEPVEVVSEDGTKTPAPDGEHELFLRDSEGNEVRIRVMTKDGKITERMNVEEMKSETKKVEPLPNTTMEDKANEVTDLASMAGEDIGGEEESDEVTVSPETIPADDDKVQLGKKMEEMAYRIEELEKKMAEFIKVKEEKMSAAEEIAVEEIELPKLDGAPVEEAPKLGFEKSYGKKVQNSQTSFLSKLYK